jgi:hypothetical protein
MPAEINVEQRLFRAPENAQLARAAQAGDKGCQRTAIRI